MRGCARICGSVSRRAVVSGDDSGTASTIGSMLTDRRERLCPEPLSGTKPGACSTKPASASPSSKARSCTSVVASRSTTSMPGSMSRKPRSHPGSGPKPTVETKPSRRRPTAPCPTVRAIDDSAAACCSSCRTGSTSACPAGVSDTCRRVRSKSGTPRRASSCWMASVSGGWVMLSCLAARPKCSTSASTRNWRHTRNSIWVLLSLMTWLSTRSTTPRHTKSARSRARKP